MLMIDGDPDETQAADHEREKQPRARTIAVPQSSGPPPMRTTFRSQTMPPTVVPFSFHMMAP